MMALQNKAALAGLALIGLLWGAFSIPSGVSAGERFDDGDVEAIEGIIRDYLLQNPEILTEAKRFSTSARPRRRYSAGAN